MLIRKGAILGEAQVKRKRKHNFFFVKTGDCGSSFTVAFSMLLFVVTLS